MHDTAFPLPVHQLPPAWLDELAHLVQRWSHHNIAGDLASMTLPELWGLYLYLRRLQSE